MKQIRYVVIRFIVFEEDMLIRLILLNSNQNYLLLFILSASFYVLNFFFIIFTTKMYKIIITMFCSFHDIIEIKNSECSFPVSNYCRANNEIILCKYN